MHQPSDQPINSAVPEERHYDEDETQINIDEEDLIEKYERDNENAFNVFDEFILNEADCCIVSFFIFSDSFLCIAIVITEYRKYHYL